MTAPFDDIERSNWAARKWMQKPSVLNAAARPVRCSISRRENFLLITGSLIETRIIQQYFLVVSNAFKNGRISSNLLQAARQLGHAVDRLKFSAPVTHVYNPLVYAWSGHEMYLQKFGDGRKRIVFLGMNPGPFGMVQTGVPFGEINAVRDWLGIECAILKPKIEHPSRPITGFACARSEVSGQRLWGLFAERFGKAQNFFAEHIVLNYCPLAFVEESGKNRTPDKLTAREQHSLFKVCDDHLRSAIQSLNPEWVIGIGNFAAKRAEHVCGVQSIKLGSILHPSPASPAANRDWSATVQRQLQELGVWK